MGYDVIGQDYHGNDAYLASGAAAWWRLWYAKVREDLPDCKIIIVQAKGGAEASAGTHSTGHAIDLQSWHLTRSQIERVVAHARHYGASGTWYRWSAQGFEPHIHMALDMPDVGSSCQYQVDAVRVGYNGLGYRGRKGSDYHPAPARWVTANEGETLMKQEDDLDKATLIAGVREAIGGINWGSENFGSYLGRMQKSASDAAYYAHQAASQTAPVTRPGDPAADSRGQVSIRQEIADAKTLDRANAARLDQLEAKLDRITSLLESKG